MSQQDVPTAGEPWRRRLAAVATAIGLVLVAITAALGQIAETRGVRAAPALAALAPGKIGVIRSAQVDAAGRLPEGLANAGYRALPGNPLAYEPFFAVAADAMRDPRSAGSAADAGLLQEAVRRNPRAREARLLLMRHFVATGKLGPAIDQLAILARLDSAAVGQLMAALGKTISSERQIDEAVAALQPHPELYQSFVGGFISARKPAGLTVRLFSRLPPAMLANSDIRQAALGQLVEAGAIRQARAIWNTTHAQGATETLIVSPDFRNSRLGPPFGWRLEQSSVGVAERAPGGGVSVEYYGREVGALVSQVMTLTAGNYRAVLDYRNEAGTDSALYLQFGCIGADKVTRAPVTAGPGASSKIGLDFTVPAQGCQGQVLSLSGLPLEDRAPQTVFVRSLNVRRMGGA